MDVGLGFGVGVERCSVGWVKEGALDVSSGGLFNEPYLEVMVRWIGGLLKSGMLNHLAYQFHDTILLNSQHRHANK